MWVFEPGDYTVMWWPQGTPENLSFSEVRGKWLKGKPSGTSESEKWYNSDHFAHVKKAD